MNKGANSAHQSAPVSRTLFVLLVLALAIFPLTGCRYMVNRTADFGDIFQLGAGVTAEQSTMGPIPPAIGFNVQVTDFLNLGALHFNGYTADWNGRALFAGHESRSLVGYLPFQMLNVRQDLKHGASNYFKQPNTEWADRMASPCMRWYDTPAKQLNWSLWDDTYRYGVPLFPRGWQYWENIGVEVAISEPFVTHLGVDLRAGFDLSEVMDFALGLFCIDFKRDDLNRSEFREACAAMCFPVEKTCSHKEGKAPDDAKKHWKKPVRCPKCDMLPSTPR